MFEFNDFGSLKKRIRLKIGYYFCRKKRIQ
jgi:hypothetical protein